MSERTARLALSSASVAITDYVISEAKTQLVIQNNNVNSIRIDDIHINGQKCWIIGTNQNPSLNPTLRIGEKRIISCGSATAESKSKFSYPISITYTDLSNNGKFTQEEDSLVLVGKASSFECPEGFIPVPGGFVLADGSTVDDFCVAKYEMKDVGGVATSQASGTPWVNIDWYDSVSNCTDLGSGYDLISDQQWMVLAENILNTNINDLNGSASGPQLATGHSDNSPSGAQVSLATEDPVVTGCDLNQPADASANAYVEGSCEIQGSGVGSKGYYNTGDAFSGTYNPSSSGGRDEMRTHVLSNGEVVWDLAGNVYQWSGDIIATTPSSDGWYNSVTDYSGIEWMKPSQLGDGGNNGFGYRDTYGSTGVVALRGGRWSYGGLAGAFFVFGDDDPSVASPGVGFRCVYSPGG